VRFLTREYRGFWGHRGHAARFLRKGTKLRCCLVSARGSGCRPCR
jgi:hypothetical protein